MKFKSIGSIFAHPRGYFKSLLFCTEADKKHANGDG